jgi:hypothetical protein
VCRSASLVVQYSKAGGRSAQDHFTLCSDCGSDDLCQQSLTPSMADPDQLSTYFNRGLSFWTSSVTSSKVIRCSSGENRLRLAATNCRKFSRFHLSSSLSTSVNSRTSSVSPESLMDIPRISSQPDRSWRHLFQALVIGMLVSVLKSAIRMFRLPSSRFLAVASSIANVTSTHLSLKHFPPPH